MNIFKWKDYERAFKSAIKGVKSSELQKIIKGAQKQLDYYGAYLTILGFGELVARVRHWVAEADTFTHQSGPAKSEWVLDLVFKTFPGAPMSLVNAVKELAVQLLPRKMEGK